MTEPILDVSDLTVFYGANRALGGVDLAVESGTLVGLIGPNGAGKTTFIDAVTGFLKPSEGSIHFDGVAMHGTPAHARARAGLARTFQGTNLFDDLTVEDNLRVAAELPNLSALFGDALRPWRRPRPVAIVEQLIEDLDLGDARETIARELPHGTRRLVGLGRTLASSPRCVLLDEPAAGLDATESAELGATLRRLVDDGLSAVLVDHDVDLVFATCDRVAVLDFGRILVEDVPETVRRHPVVVEAYLGSVGETDAATGAPGDDS